MSIIKSYKKNEMDQVRPRSGHQHSPVNLSQYTPCCKAISLTIMHLFPLIYAFTRIHYASTCNFVRITWLENSPAKFREVQVYEGNFWFSYRFGT